MKMLLIECDADELKANRTVLDSIADAIGGFAQSFAGLNLSNQKIIDAMNNYNPEEGKEELKEAAEE